MDPSGPWFWLVVFGALALVFASPTIVALLRQVDGLGAVIIINAIGLVTLVALPVALCMAFALPRRQQRPVHPWPAQRPIPPTHTHGPLGGR